MSSWSTIGTTTDQEVKRWAMKTPVHPGEILREDVLADLGLGVGEAAARLGISRVSLSRVLHGHARISPNLAVRLEQAGAGTARAWLAMQTSPESAVPARRGMTTSGCVAPDGSVGPGRSCKCSLRRARRPVTLVRGAASRSARFSSIPTGRRPVEGAGVRLLRSP